MVIDLEWTRLFSAWTRVDLLLFLLSSLPNHSFVVSCLRGLLSLWSPLICLRPEFCPSVRIRSHFLGDSVLCYILFFPLDSMFSCFSVLDFNEAHSPVFLRKCAWEVIFLLLCIFENVLFLSYTWSIICIWVEFWVGNNFLPAFWSSCSIFFELSVMLLKSPAVLVSVYITYLLLHNKLP